MASKTKHDRRIVSVLIVLFVLLDIYIASFFILLKPRHDLYQIEKEDEVEYISKFGNPDSYAYKTFTYISDDKSVNTAGYYFYWPIHKPLSYIENFEYVVDPEPIRLKMEERIQRN